MTWFTLPGPPVPKDRARHGKGGTYSTARTRRVEHDIGMSYIAAGGRRHDDGPVTVMITIQVARPATHLLVDGSLSKRGEAMPYPTRVRTPDVDNVAKAVLDGLNGVAYRDDRQVVALLVQRMWAATHADVCTHVSVRTVGA